MELNRTYSNFLNFKFNKYTLSMNAIIIYTIYKLIRQMFSLNLNTSAIAVLAAVLLTALLLPSVSHHPSHSNLDLSRGYFLENIVPTTRC